MPVGAIECFVGVTPGRPRRTEPDLMVGNYLGPRLIRTAAIIKVFTAVPLAEGRIYFETR